MPIFHDQLPGDGVTLHALRAGEGSRTVVLLHGFPDNSTTWLRQIGPLVDAGFSVVAPDLRGYGSSDRPAYREAYRMRHLAGDIATLVRGVSDGPASVVGHDWGGMVAWALAARHPEVVDRLVILNAPHPRLFRKRLRSSSQALRSWYALAFLVPVVPERVLAANDFWLIRKMLRTTGGREPPLSRDRVDAVIDELRVPGALRAALDYYRANTGGGGGSRSDGPRARPGAVSSQVVRAPTLVLWGERDPALGIDLLRGLDDYVADLTVRRFPDAGHWVHWEAAEEVNRALIEFLLG